MIFVCLRTAREKFVFWYILKPVYIISIEMRTVNAKKQFLLKEGEI